MADLLDDLGSRWGGELFLKCDLEEITYREAGERVSRLAFHLDEYIRGGGNSRKKNPTFALFLNPSPLYVLLVLAVYRLRLWGWEARILPLNPHKPPKVREDEMLRAGVDLLIHDRMNHPGKSSYPTLRVEDLGDGFSTVSVRKYKPETKKTKKTHQTTPLVILPTSGSSGESKLAVFSWDNWMRSAVSGDRFFPFRRGDRWLHLLPFYHVSGMSIIFRALLHQAAIVFTEKSRENWERILLPYGITHVSLVPSQLIGKTVGKTARKMTARFQALSRLKMVLIGGGPMPEFIRRHLSPPSPFRPSYGLTESVAHVAIYDGKYDGKDHGKDKGDNHSLDSTGGLPLKILYRRKIRVRGGEILIHRDSLFLGYWKGKLIRPWNREGWFATGDMGEVRGGMLWVRGRKDRQFISGGENIFPEEIETAILSFSPEIDRVCVFPIPDRRWGMVPGAALGGEVHPEVVEPLVKFLSGRLEGYKIPHRFFSLPRSGGMKVSYVEVEENFRKKKLSLLSPQPE